MIETPLQRCAVVLMALGEDQAAEVIKHLNSEEVQELSTAMATIGPVTRKEMLEVLEQFREESSQFMAVQLGSTEYITEVLVRALGQERAAGIIEDIMDASNTSVGIEALNAMDASNIAELISSEHPQVIATILIHLDRNKAAEVLSQLSERIRDDVIMRVATFGGVQPAAMSDLTDTFNDILSGQSMKRSKLGGVRTAAEIINAMSGQQEETILSKIAEVDSDLAQRIREDMFTFNNIADLGADATQAILREATDVSWAVALKGASQQMVDHIMSNMSKRAAEMLRDELDGLPPLKVSVIENERKKILAVARALADKGEIDLTNKGADEYI